MTVAEKEAVVLQKLKDEIKHDRERHEKTRAILRSEKSFAEKLRNPEVQNLYQALIKRLANEIAILGFSTRLKNLPEGVTEQLKDRLEQLGFQPITPEQEAELNLDGAAIETTLYDISQYPIELEAKAGLNPTLRSDLGPINMPNTPGGITRVKLYVWPNYIGVCLRTNYGNYTGAPANLLEYFATVREFIEEAIKKSAAKKADLPGKSHILDNEKEKQAENKIAKPTLKRKAVTQNDELDKSDEQSVAKTPRPNPFKTTQP